MREKILIDDNWKFHLGNIDKKLPVEKGPIYIRSKTESERWGEESTVMFGLLKQIKLR